MFAYYNGQFLKKEDIAISPDDRGFLFADGIYEVIRCYNGLPFQIDAHFKRLHYGASQLQLAQQNFDYLQEICQQLLERNDLQHCDATIYMQISRGIAPRTHIFPPMGTPLTIYITAKPFNSDNVYADMEKGIVAISMPDTRWSRCDIKAIGLTANILASQRAAEVGASEAILVRDGVLLEGSHSNFAAVTEGRLVTAPLSNYILGGITRQTVLEIAKKIDIPVEERPIYWTERERYSEYMILGTTTEITPVVQLDGTMIGDGKKGVVVEALQAAFQHLYLRNRAVKG